MERPVCPICDLGFHPGNHILRLPPREGEEEGSVGHYACLRKTAEARPVVVLDGVGKGTLLLISIVSAALEAAGRSGRAAEWRGRALECAGEAELFELAHEYVRVQTAGCAPARDVL